MGTSKSQHAVTSDGRTGGLEPRPSALSRDSVARLAGRWGNAAAAQELAGAADAAAAPARALSLARMGIRRPLPGIESLEEEFGVDLSNIEAYFGDEATRACQSVGAEAFTVGNIIAFSEETPGADVVRHEVTHALQQGGDVGSMAAGAAPSRTTSAGDAEEQEASGNESAIVQEARAYGKHDTRGEPALARLPAPPSFGVHRAGL